jgi:SAM-dependent methyltransferase
MNDGAASDASEQGEADAAHWTRRFCCPVCFGVVERVAVVEYRSHRLKEGQLVCATCDRVVAVVSEGTYDFRIPKSERFGSVEPMVVDATCERRVPADSPEITYTSRWGMHHPYFMATEGRVGDSGTFTGTFTDVLIRFLHHPRGGIVDVFVDDKLTVSVDLFTPEGSSTEPVVAASDLPPGEHTLVFAARGQGNDDATATQVLVEELVLFGPAELPGFGPPVPLNFGNPYSRFIEGYVDRVAPQEQILEVGGGDRRRCLPNHVNFEYLKFELADVHGDIHAIPFQDDTFALVHSQAVFEHVNDPFVAARELIRVTRPGGIIVTEVAFLQPLHAVPYHFFNMTLWGVEELFKDCELLASDWFGPLSETVLWLMQSAGLPGKIEAERIDRIVTEFQEFDGLISHDELKPVASGVHIAVRTPG